MVSIILPIHKKYCDLIFSGVKKYEYRRSMPKLTIDEILVYEAKGCGKIIGQFEVDEILKDCVDNLWRLTESQSGTDKYSFEEYFKSKSMGYAIRIGAYKLFDLPKELTEYGLSKPPQNFVYVSK